MGMQSISRWICLAFTLLLFFTSTAVMAKLPIRIAFGDIPGVDMLNFLTAVERAKERGVDIQVAYLQSEDIASQAVISGEADIGVGTPYALIESGEPIRMFYQLSTLRFFPMVNTRYYKTWKDLDGAEVYTHARGSGTEAIMNLMARNNGIKYKRMNYMPGSAVRAQAMLRGRIKASIVDARRSKLLLEKGKGRFTTLPLPEIKASDEALYANVNFLEQNSEAINILLEELVTVWRLVNKDYNYMIEAQQKYNLLPELWPDKKSEVLSYYKEFVGIGGFPNNGGGKDAVRADLEFYGFAGTIKGDVSKLEINNFWTLEPLNNVLKKLGRKQ